MSEDEKTDELVRYMSLVKSQQSDLLEKDELLEDAASRLAFYIPLSVRLQEQIDSMQVKEREKDTVIVPEVPRVPEPTVSNEMLIELKETQQELKKALEMEKKERKELEIAHQEASQRMGEYRLKYEAAQDIVKELRHQSRDFDSLQAKLVEKEEKMFELMDELQQNRQVSQTEHHSNEIQYIRQVDELKSQNELLRQENQTRNNELKVGLQLKQEEMKKLRDELEMNKRELIRLHEKERSDQTMAFEKRYGSLKEEYESLEKDVASRDVEIDRLLTEENTRNERYRVNVQELKTKCDEYEATIKRLNEELQQTRTQHVEEVERLNKTHCDTMTLQSKQLESSNDHRMELQHEIERSMTTQRELKRMVETSIVQMEQQHQAKIDQYESKLDVFESRVDKTKKQLVVLREKLMAHRVEQVKDQTSVEYQMQSLNQEKERLRGEIERLKLQAETKENHHTRLAESNRVLILELEERRAMSDSTRKQFASLLKEKNTLTLTIKNLRSQVVERDEQLNYYINKFQQSTLEFSFSSNQDGPGSLLERLEAIGRDAERLTRRSCSYFETKGTSEKQTQKLFQANARLTSNLQRWADAFEQEYHHREEDPISKESRESPEKALGAARVHESYHANARTLEKLGDDLRQIHQKIRQCQYN